MGHIQESPPERGEILIPDEMETGETYLEVSQYQELEGYDVVVGKMKNKGFIPRAIFQVSGNETYLELPAPGYDGARDPAEKETMEGDFTVLYYELSEDINPGLETAGTDEMFKALHLTSGVVENVKSKLEKHGYSEE